MIITYLIYLEKALCGHSDKNPKTGEPDSALATKICRKSDAKGLLLVHTGRESIKIGPPLTIPDRALVEGIEVIDECFQEAISENKTQN